MEEREARRFHAWWLRFIEGCSYRTMGQRLGVSASRARVILQQARGGLMSYQKAQVGEGMKYPFILILDYHTGASIARRQLSFETLSSMVDAANNFGRQPSTRRVITTVILSDQHYMNGNQQGRQL